MKISANGFAEILAHEAIVTRRYKDSVGVWTFGVGHTKNAGDPDPVTIIVDQPIADIVRLFRRDLQKYEDGVNRAVTVEVSQHEFDALVSFHFNTGAIGKASFVKKLNAGDRAGAAKGMLAWNKPPEIIGRRTAEQRLFRDGTYSGDGFVNVFPATDRGAVMRKKVRKVSLKELTAGVAQVPAPRVQQVQPLLQANPDLDRDMAEALRYKTMVQDAQAALTLLGYPTGGIDGEIGGFTTAALAAYRFDRNLPAQEGVDKALIDDLLAAAETGWSRPIAPERAEKPEAEIAKDSKTMQVSWWGKILAAVGLGGGTAGNVLKDALAPDVLEEHLSIFERVMNFAGQNWIMLVGLVVAGLGAWGAFKLIDRFKVQDYREGRKA
jgi:lysozyme